MDEIVELCFAGLTPYAMDTQLTRADYQKLIDRYTDELEWAKAEGLQNLVDAYTELLRENLEGYEKTPQEFAYEPGTTQLHSYAITPVEQNGISVNREDGRQITEEMELDIGKEVVNCMFVKDGLRYYFTVNNDGVFGATMQFYLPDAEFRASNTTKDDARQIADELMNRLDGEITPVNTLVGTDENGDAAYYELTYRPAMEGIAFPNTRQVIDSVSDDGEFAKNMVPMQEKILITVDDRGIVGFSNQFPFTITAQ